jgi:Rod binding domain-containing protein
MSALDLSQTASTASLGASAQPKPKNAAEAAKQFEALLIAQMLRTARESANTGGEDSTGETMFDLAGQQFAQMLANNGGLGLAKMISAGLKGD